jgi:hypothetical protein
MTESGEWRVMRAATSRESSSATTKIRSGRFSRSSSCCASLEIQITKDRLDSVPCIASCFLRNVRSIGPDFVDLIARGRICAINRIRDNVSESFRELRVSGECSAKSTEEGGEIFSE